MFICYFCQKTVKPRTNANKVVVKWRMHQHPYRSKVQPRWGYDKQGKKKLEWIDDKGNSGLQIVKEVYSCPDCAAKYEREHPLADVRAELLSKYPVKFSYNEV